MNIYIKKNAPILEHFRYNKLGVSLLAQLIYIGYNATSRKRKERFKAIDQRRRIRGREKERRRERSIYRENSRIAVSKM